MIYQSEHHQLLSSKDPWPSLLKEKLRRHLWKTNVQLHQGEVLPKPRKIEALSINHDSVHPLNRPSLTRPEGHLSNSPTDPYYPTEPQHLQQFLESVMTGYHKQRSTAVNLPNRHHLTQERRETPPIVNVFCSNGTQSARHVKPANEQRRMLLSSATM